MASKSGEFCAISGCKSEMQDHARSCKIGGKSASARIKKQDTRHYLNKRYGASGPVAVLELNRAGQRCHRAGLPMSHAPQLWPAASMCRARAIAANRLRCHTAGLLMRQVSQLWPLTSMCRRCRRNIGGQRQPTHVLQFSCHCIESYSRREAEKTWTLGTSRAINTIQYGAKAENTICGPHGGPHVFPASASACIFCFCSLLYFVSRPHPVFSVCLISFPVLV